MATGHMVRSREYCPLFCAFAIRNFPFPPGSFPDLRAQLTTLSDKPFLLIWLHAVHLHQKTFYNENMQQTPKSGHRFISRKHDKTCPNTFKTWRNEGVEKTCIFVGFPSLPTFYKYEKPLEKSRGILETWHVLPFLLYTTSPSPLVVSRIWGHIRQLWAANIFC